MTSRQGRLAAWLLLAAVVAEVQSTTCPGSSPSCACGWTNNGANCGVDDGSECFCRCCCSHTGSCKWQNMSPPPTTPAPVPGGLTCSDVWNNQACVNGECYSCGARINYLVGTGKSEADAKYQVGVVEFPSVCGACVTCDDVWNKDACGAGGCYTCGARIDYLMSTGMERSAASRQVGVDEFPVPCWPCAAGSIP